MLRTAQRQCACKPIIAVGMDMRNSRRDNCRFRGAREIADFLYLNACVCVCGVAAIVNWLGLGGAFASMFYCRKLLEETQLAEMDHCRRFYVQLFEAILPFASTSPRRISTKLPLQHSLNMTKHIMGSDGEEYEISAMPRGQFGHPLLFVRYLIKWIFARWALSSREI